MVTNEILFILSEGNNDVLAKLEVIAETNTGQAFIWENYKKHFTGKQIIKKYEKES